MIMDWRVQLKEIGKMIISGTYWCLRGLGKILSDVFFPEQVKSIAQDSILNLTYDSYGNVIVDINSINARIIPLLDKHLDGVKYNKTGWTKEGAYYISYDYIDFKDERYADNAQLVSNLVTRDILSSYYKKLSPGDVGQLDYYVICDAITGFEEKKIYVIYYAYPGSQALIDSVKKMIG